jgi:hypothetical protein
MKINPETNLSQMPPILQREKVRRQSNPETNWQELPWNNPDLQEM